MTTIEEVLANTKEAWHLFVLPKPCREWKGKVNRKGYVHINFNGKNKFAHRLTYAEQFGEVPPEVKCHHICGSPRCLEPTHLWAMSQREHLRIEDPMGVCSSQSHCPHGHPFDEENTRWRSGKRQCHQCELRRNRKTRAKDPEKKREYERQYRTKNREHINERQRERSRTFREKQRPSKSIESSQPE